jgi:hypothetical protein
METVQQATKLLNDTEGKLRELVSTAASSGDYASVVHMAAWARTISELIKGTASEAKTPANHTSPVQPNGKNGKHAAPRSKAAHHIQKSYPQFYRQGDQLIRIAWSKREKKEYRHKAPLFVLRGLAKAMAEKGADGRVFSTDQFLPIPETSNGEVPNYQAYVGISMFKQTGLIDQHGRQGYSIPRLAEFKDAVEAIWKKLPELQNS